MKVGNCTKCGAPYHCEYEYWHGVNPPPMTPSCECWNLPKTFSSSNVIVNKPVEETDNVMESKCNEDLQKGIYDLFQDYLEDFRIAREKKEKG